MDESGVGDQDTVVIFDTTLRDGEQSPGAALNVSEKIEIAHALEELGVDIIEAGFPISSPGDFRAVQRISREIRGCVVCGLTRANRQDIDAAAEALKDAAHPRIHTGLGVSDVHIRHKLRTTREGALEMGVEAVRYAKKFVDDVQYYAEDAGRADPEYLYRVLEALREDRRKLAALYRVNSVIKTTRDTRELLCRVLEEIFDVLHAERGFVMLLDHDTGELIPTAMRRRYARDRAEQVAISSTIARQVLEEGEAVLSTDARSDQRFSAADSVVAQGIRSAMCAPLHGRERVQGIIYVDNAGIGSFRPRDLQLLVAMAQTASELYDEQYGQFHVAFTSLDEQTRRTWDRLAAGLGVTPELLEQLRQLHDELEAIRLVDHLGLEQAAAAERMGISRRVFAIDLKNGRRKIADALLNGKAIEIVGGDYVYKVGTEE